MKINAAITAAAQKLSKEFGGDAVRFAHLIVDMIENDDASCVESAVDMIRHDYE